MLPLELGWPERRTKVFGRLALVICFLAISAPIALRAQVAELPTLTPPGGTVRALAADPGKAGRLLLGTTTGMIYESNDSGGGWHLLSRVTDHEDWVVAALVADPRDAGSRGGERWYAALYSLTSSEPVTPQAGGLFVSDDGGRHWHPALAGHAVRALAVAPSDPDILVIATLDGVYRSSDHGLQWARISPASNRELADIESVAIDPHKPDEIFVGTWHLPWKTFDGGRDWLQLNNGLIDDSDVFSIAIDHDRPTIVYLSACSGIYRSDSSGVQFAKIQGIPYTARRTRALVQDPAHPGVIYAGTTQGLWITRDAGATWTLATDAQLSVNAVLPLPGRLILGTEYDGVWVSEDDGATFRTSNQGFSNRQIASIAEVPGARYVAVTGDPHAAGVYLTEDDGFTWSRLAAGLGSHQVFGLLPVEDQVLAATDHGVYEWNKTVWIQVHTSPSGNVFDLSQAGGYVYAAADNGLYRSPDDGQDWERLAAAPDPLYHVLAVDQWVFVTGKGFLVRSPNRGDGFVPGSLYIKGQFAQVAAGDSAGGHALLLAATSDGLYESEDMGQNWRLAAHGLPQQPMRAIEFASDGIYATAAAVAQVYRSTDRGLSWQLVSLEAEEESISRMSHTLLPLPSTGAHANASGAAQRSSRRPNGQPELPENDHPNNDH